MNGIQLALVEDDAIVNQSLVTFFSQVGGIETLNASKSVEEFIVYLQLKESKLPNILLLDIQLPGMSGIEGISEVRQYLPNIDIIMLTTFEDNDKIFAALCAGACSYLLKEASLTTILDCVVTVNNGGSFMSPGIARKIAKHFLQIPKIEYSLSKRHEEIVSGIVDGFSYKMIGQKLNISLDTVRTHIMQIYRELNIHSKGELIKWALKRG